VSLPNGQTLLISYTDQVMGVYWFEGSLKTEPVKSLRILSSEWPGIYTRHGWDLVMLLQLVLTVSGDKNGL